MNLSKSMESKIYILFWAICLVSCDSLLDNNLDGNYTPIQAYASYDRMVKCATACYYPLNTVAGFYRLDNSLEACMCDEAEETNPYSSVQLFNSGGWTQYNNPDDVYAAMYDGIIKCNEFISNSNNFRTQLVVDTFTSAGRETYLKRVEDIAFYRAEARFLRAYYYAELIKRYGGVAIVTDTTDVSMAIYRQSYDSCVSFIVNEIDAISKLLQVDWNAAERPEVYGRATAGAALMLKSRVLLYAASPLHNPMHDEQKWIAAAKAAKAVLDCKKVGSKIKPLYELDTKYQNLFVAPSSYLSVEVIFFIKFVNSNLLERLNYPIGTPGGQSGVAPSQNIVDAYEHLPGWEEDKPYENIDPRFNYTIACNGSTWNGRTIESYVGGLDGPDRYRASRTGYYLKKFLSPSLNLTGSTPDTSLKCWIFMRYAEAMLNYAEAMNEVYGPNGMNASLGLNLSARTVLNQVRKRADVALPNVTTSEQSAFQQLVRHERQVELAFEGHRAWDLRRWKMGAVLKEPLRGVRIAKNQDGSLSYDYEEIEPRVFDESKMYFYPIPQSEINKIDIINFQNEGW